MILTSFILLLITFFFFARLSKETFVFRLFIWGFLIRVIIMLLDCYEIIGVPGNGDEEQFHTTALDNQNAREPFYITNYTVFLTLFYQLSDNSRLLAQYVNVLMGMFFLMYLNKTLMLIKTEIKTRKQILIIAAIMPNLVFFAATLLREAWIELFIMMSLFYYVKWFINSGKPYDAVLSVVFIFSATWMHSGCFMMILGYILSFFLYNKQSKTIHLSNSFIPALLLVGGVSVILLSNMSSFMAKIGSIEDLASADVIVERYTITVEAGSTYLDWLSVTSPVQAFLFAPLKMFYFLFSPILFDWRNLVDVFAFALDSTVYIFLFYQIAKRKSDSREKKYLIRFLLISFFFATFVFAIGTIASGTAMRHRAKIIAILFVCYGLTRTNNQDKTKDYILCAQ